MFWLAFCQTATSRCAHIEPRQPPCMKPMITNPQLQEKLTWPLQYIAYTILVHGKSKRNETNNLSLLRSPSANDAPGAFHQAQLFLHFFFNFSFHPLSGACCLLLSSQPGMLSCLGGRQAVARVHHEQLRTGQDRRQPPRHSGGPEGISRRCASGGPQERP